MISARLAHWRAALLDWSRNFAPKRFPYARFALALAVALAGGFLFQHLKLPLPFMLGAMVACTLASLTGLPVAAPPAIRPPMTAVLGVLLGAGFSPEIFGRLPEWWSALLGLFVFMALSAVSVSYYFHKFGRFDATTAFFSGMPGGLNEMITIGEERGGDPRVIALSHSARILLVVMTLPFVIQWAAGISLSRTGGGVSLVDAPLSTELWLILCGVLGMMVGDILNLPAKGLLGPMLVSVAVHLAGLSTFKPPVEIVNAAQLTLGMVIGCRFADTSSRMVLRILALSVGSTLILLFWTVTCALLVSAVSPFPAIALMLAYSPGGLAEMSLIALALQAEVAFVAAMHIIRILVVMVSAASVHGCLERFFPAPAEGAGEEESVLAE